MLSTSKLEVITPEIAKQLLETNTSNRSVNARNLDAIIADMSKGVFKQTGESIKIAENGILLDGQHRLHAIIKTGKTLSMWVVRGLDNDAFKYIDTGRSRKASDVLAIEGVYRATKMATMSKFIINFQKSRYVAVAEHSLQFGSRISNADISAFVAKNKNDLEDSYHYGHNKYNKIISGTTLASFHYIFNKIDSKDADDFCHKISEGADLKTSSPIHLLRQRLIFDIRSTKKMRNLEKLALVCKAWNLYRTNKTTTVLRWESIREPFPKPM